MAFGLCLPAQFGQVGTIAHAVAEDLIAARQILRRAMDIRRADREHVTAEEVTAALRLHSITWSEYPALTFPGEQHAIKTQAGVTIGFTTQRPDWVVGAPPGPLLHSMYKRR